MIHTNHHYFLRNKEIDSLYITISLMSFAEGLISIFVPIFLFQLGYPIWQIITYYFMDALYFVAFAFMLLPIFKKLSDKSLIFISLPLLFAYYYLLPYIRTEGYLFLLLPILLSFYRLFFNMGYSTDFSCSSDKKDICKEVGLQYTFISLVQFSSPLLGGLLIIVNGFNFTFLIAAIIVFISIIPLLFFKKRETISQGFTRKDLLGTIVSKKYKFMNMSGIGYAIEATTSNVLWPLYLFIFIGSIKTIGGIFSIVLLLTAIITYIVGVMSDRGMYKKIIAYTMPLISLFWISRIYFNSAELALSSTVIKGVVYSILLVAWSGLHYKVAKEYRNPGNYVLALDVIFNMTRVIVLPVLAIAAAFSNQNTFFAIVFLVAATFSTLFFLSTKQKLENDETISDSEAMSS